MPTLEPCEAGLTISGRPTRSSARSRSAVLDEHGVYGGAAKPAPTTTRLVLSLSMVSAEASTPLPGVGNAEPLERALHEPILAARTVQRDPGAVESRARQVLDRALPRIEGLRIDAAAQERREHGVAAQERNLALARVAAEQHRHLAELARSPRAPAARVSRSSRLMRAPPRCALRSSSSTPCTCCHRAPHVLDQRLDVGGARGAVVDDEIGVLLAIPRHRRCDNP